MKAKKSRRLSSSQSPHRFPWWIHVMLAIVSYCLLKYVVPGLHLNNPAFQKLIQAAPTFAPPASILFLLLAAKRLYDTDREDQQADQVDDKDIDTPEEK